MNGHLRNYETLLTIETRLGGDLLYERVAISLKTGQATIVPSLSSDTVRIVFEEKFILDMHGMEETIRHGAEYTQWVHILSLFLSLPLSLSSSSVSSVTV